MKGIKKVISVVVIVCIIIGMIPAAFAEGAQLELTSKSAILMEKSTGRILYEMNPDEKLPPASVTKIMTMLLIMEAIDSGKIRYDDIVTSSANATSLGGSQVYLKEGEQMTVDEMLKCIAVASANDACVAMAEYIAGSEAEFVQMMNDKAKELGMENTTFINCHGLDTDGHLTTARDIALMSRELILKHEDIKKYTTIWMDTIRSGEFGLTNTNKLIRFYENATGLKTGSTGKALYCMSATALKDGMELIAVVMAAPSSDDRANDAKALLNYGFAKYSLYLGQNQAEQFDPVRVIKGKSGYVNVKTLESSDIVVEKGQADKIERTVTLSEDVSAPVEQNQKLGEITLALDGKTLATIDIVADTAVPKAGLWDILKIVVKQFLTL